MMSVDSWIVKYLKNILKAVFKPLYYLHYILIDHKLKKMVTERPLKIVVGTSGVFEKSWIPTDISHLNLLNDSDWQRYFVPDSIDVILAEHVFEHLTPEEAAIALENCFRYLKTGGYIRTAVPDGFHPSPNYINCVKPGGAGLGASDHKVLYDYLSFSLIFTVAGLKVDLLEYFDENGTFHFKEWQREKGMITRSSKFDERNSGTVLNYTSIILDAWKEQGE